MTTTPASAPNPHPARLSRRALAAAALAGLALLVPAVLDARSVPAPGGAVFRCRAALPGVACEMAGIAVRPGAPGGPLDIVASACSQPTMLEYCNVSSRPTPGLNGGLLFLHENGPSFTLAGNVALEDGYGDAAWSGDGFYQAIYTRGGIARFAVAPGAVPSAAEVAFVPLPGGGRIGGLATDGAHLYAHETGRDRILVLDAGSGALRRVLPVPAAQAVNGLAYLGGRLYAVINDDEMSGDSTGDGPADEAIVALDPADGAVVAKWTLPDGVYPHSMDVLGPQSLAVMVQTEPGPLAPVHVWEFIPGPGGGVTIVPCP